ncbi:brain and acute leukemia cytoplasmic protein isoform X4 [Syngnathoides biaculeatus]|uniref:brain and acute leukemia cytoplasmic protein isoform X4 n=1 Tax=Syngnathoides biaculeatus TaxID=300417 RepID=UPI002ADD87C2|nr:brain and acute leukemia cytoplasmic protein isoform X4 [Syngnathoides biaculeatus]
MMGCGGSRADAIIEPRYHESWTRETESTWLTNTDVEAPLPVGNGKAFEGGLREKRMVTTGTQCGKQTLAAAAAGAAGSGSGCNHHRRPRRSFSDLNSLFRPPCSKPVATPSRRRRPRRRAP